MNLKVEARNFPVIFLTPYVKILFNKFFFIFDFICKFQNLQISHLESVFRLKLFLTCHNRFKLARSDKRQKFAQKCTKIYSN